ncbi:glycosyltransferase family 2 protein [Clavibacter michiganensis]|uniref:Glycosyl transferase n=1 Tax=Clavibacter michiganensis subsp. insidiosus TaxID=33014 RepID=A0A0D5CH68_9MICO|nr:glycosyltransferase [Clavibacter michiganensis]AJW78630.1 glycosyl transferase [Clavibacter michiganensis subsp. insidiosus]AWF98717.1 glycosyl transferase [Clavibacter michiganensis subsp. insidiosus]AWG01065.1 glycosyl transferase [Clavibacter michiganensis subsp. insidiosus]OQJ60367.1 glycosyl transferase [Clavibacter michiganensis subsp. insidiosus]RII87818.1 glycosyltransferase family 2 protein [Clavibacter michiganensis subsp. insidiosus]
MTGAVPRVGVVVLSQGRRPEGLAASLASVLRQEGVALDVVVVGNGWEPDGLPDGVRCLHLPENLGIPAGRNAGVPLVTGETLFFLDDDETVPSAAFLADCLALMRGTDDVALIQPRIVDPTGAATPRRWIPRIRKGDPARSSPVMSVLEGAVVVRRDAFEGAGGWAGEFFYAHEGIELAWRIWDQGHRAWYAGDLVAHHPAVAPTRHAEYHRLTARNRVWLARRNLPLPLVPVYVGSWTAVQLIRSARNRDGLGTWLHGWLEGWTTSPGTRRPMSWGTVVRMARAGRPPVI